MAELRRFVHRHTGAVRMSSSFLGHPYTEQSAEDAAAAGYGGQTVVQLREQLGARGLDTAGKKAELVERLEASDSATVAGGS